MRTFTQPYALIFTLSLLVGCGNPGQNGEPKESQTKESSETTNPDIIELSNEQVKTAGISTGRIKQKVMRTKIPVNGTIELQPNYLVSVTPPADGYVVSVLFQEGDKVKQGETLAILRHPDYIQLQQDFLESKGRYEYLQLELKRQQTLSNAKVSAKKKYQQTKADYEAAKAKYMATREKLDFLGIAAGKVATGNLQKTISLNAPISGNISKVNLNKGQLVGASKTVFTLINNKHLNARLKIFETDVNQVRKGEQFTFSVPAFDDSTTYSGQITGIDRTLNPESKMMDAIGTIEPSPELMPGLYIEARILSPERNVLALPRQAIVRDQDAEYVFISKGLQEEDDGKISRVFERKLIQTGIRNNDYIQIINADDFLNREIVTSGAFYLKAEMNKGEGDDD